jgi:hypothetical protein
VPASPPLFKLINGGAAAAIAVAGAVPLLALRLWSRRTPRGALLTLAWVVAVRCCLHALVNGVQRFLSLAGQLTIRYPASVWTSGDRRAADLQDLFFVVGLGLAAIAWKVLCPNR